VKIEKVNFVEGARNARGIAVIIDVFRAFSVACYCFDKGVINLFPVGGVNDALKLSENLACDVLIGERKGKKLPGFDYGNSPTEILAADLSGKSAVHTTHAGTQGIVNATNADEVYTGAFVNAKATADYIKSRNPQRVTLVRMGLEAINPTDEDDLCADYFHSLLTNKSVNESEIVNTLRESPCAARFFDPEKPWSPASDFDLCLDINRFNFALRARRDSSGNMRLERIDVIAG
jgi:2-phosphosulfolactate phosphatase